jgi:hypothetical protein
VFSAQQTRIELTALQRQKTKLKKISRSRKKVVACGSSCDERNHPKTKSLITTRTRGRIAKKEQKRKW